MTAQEFDQRFKSIAVLLDYIKRAQREHLDIEFVDSFLEDYRSTGDVLLSAAHAAREWDL